MEGGWWSDDWKERVERILSYFGAQNSISSMSEKKAEVAEKPPVTYVIRRGESVRKFVGWKEEAQYLADERLQTCDCPGFVNTGKCKHLEFKGLLDQFRVDELIFFGEHIGECKPKNKDQILQLIGWLGETLKSHFRFGLLDVTELVPNPADPDLFSFVRFEGKRNRNTLIVGYAHGIMFSVKSVC